jgi:hypothetical protein
MAEADISSYEPSGKQADELRVFLEEQRYFNVRYIDGGYIGLIRLLYTTALCIDLHRYGYETRFCYQDRARAVDACNALQSIDDLPLPGYIARRG